MVSGIGRVGWKRRKLEREEDGMGGVTIRVGDRYPGGSVPPAGQDWSLRSSMTSRGIRGLAAATPRSVR